MRGGPPSLGRDTRSTLERLLGMTKEEIAAEYAIGAVAEGQNLPPELTDA